MEENKLTLIVGQGVPFYLGWNDLPVELVERILAFFKFAVEGNLLLGRFVCRMWRDLLPLPTDGSLIDYDYAGVVAKRGFLELVIWARQQGFSLTASTFREAVKGGNLKILMWLKANGCPMDSDVIGDAISAGNLEVIKWLRKECFTDSAQWRAMSLGCFAARRRNLQVLKWLRLQGHCLERLHVRKPQKGAIWMFWNGYT